ncbi:2-dehydro-3-deoxygalactonokinase [Microvirga sp. P5_D2]
MFLAIEWTSVNFTAFRFADDGTLLEKRQVARGVNHITDGAFEATLRELVGDWCGEADHVYLTGMITSRNGWVETPYAEAPASFSDILTQAVVKEIAGLPRLIFLPGVSVRQPLPDMMRGEELKVFGALGDSNGLVVLPGAHSKWAAVKDGRVERFATYMTGELISFLTSNSLVSKLIPSQSSENPEAFLRGVKLARDHNVGGNILRRIFSARSLVLFESLPPEDIREYLSGLMIGAEVTETLDEFGSESDGIRLIGPQALCERYTLALGEAGCRSVRIEGADIAAFQALEKARLELTP